ncbi:hypothetical protein DFH94DRAFT_783073 [Russula ochroleuca]|jgi:hypothetical protein|uniref:Uncharacterized protein n=1 Tax=Russula ochroleuca TaxID=152965 RepID=A0A9P5MNN6_9AGAM|nr:hypothetical protein DFH94DRAFT_783073 [Russula ochroleuca]
MCTWPRVSTVHSRLKREPVGSLFSSPPPPPSLQARAGGFFCFSCLKCERVGLTSRRHPLAAASPLPTFPLAAATLSPLAAAGSPSSLHLTTAGSPSHRRPHPAFHAASPPPPQPLHATPHLPAPLHTALLPPSPVPLLYAACSRQREWSGSST